MASWYLPPRYHLDAMRFPMRLDPLWRPMLAIAGARPGNSFVELLPDAMRFRFGVMVDETVPLEEILGARSVRWPFIYGVGWRTAPGHKIGLIGSRQDVVEVTLRARREMHIRPAPWALRVKSINVSLEDPTVFANAVNRGVARRANACAAS